MSLASIDIPFGPPGILIMALGAWLWARWLIRRYPRARQLAWAQLAAIAIPITSVSFTIVGLRRSFGAVRTAPAHEKAAMMADGISLAMWSTGAAIVAMLVLLAILAVVHAQLASGEQKGPPGVGE